MPPPARFIDSETCRLCGAPPGMPCATTCGNHESAPLLRPEVLASYPSEDAHPHIFLGPPDVVAVQAEPMLRLEASDNNMMAHCQAADFIVELPNGERISVLELWQEFKSLCIRVRLLEKLFNVTDPNEKAEIVDRFSALEVE